MISVSVKRDRAHSPTGIVPSGHSIAVTQALRWPSKYMEFLHTVQVLMLRSVVGEYAWRGEQQRYFTRSTRGVKVLFTKLQQASM